MRAWFLWGLIVCCAAGGRSSWAQGCSSIDALDRTVLELRGSQARQRFRVRAQDGPGGRSFNVGEIVVLEDDGAGELIYRTHQGDTTIDIPAVARRFYRTHPDDYDFLTLFTSFPIVDPITEAPFSAYSLLVSNDIHGIHLPDLDYCEDFGSAGNLEAILNLNNFADARYDRGPYDRLPGNNDSTMSLLAHETGHRWGARIQVNDGPAGRIHRSDALLGRAFSHWSFFLHAPTLLGASSLEGNYWQFNGDGSFSTLGETDGYSALDQYLMGLRPASEVPPFFVIDGAHGHSPNDPPEPGEREVGLPHWFTIRDVIAVEGRRFPGTRSSAGAWRQAFVLVVPNRYPDTHRAELEALIRRLDAVRTEWEYYFAESSDFRANIYTGLHNAPAPLFRLYSPQTSTHFYTANELEAFEAVTFLGFLPEGNACGLFPTQAAGTVPLYRLYHPQVGTHFYTSDPFEWEGAISRDGFVPEGAVGYVYPSRIPGTIPLYRMFNYFMADHFYTADETEMGQAAAAGYELEGVVGYVLPDPRAGGK